MQMKAKLRLTAMTLVAFAVSGGVEAETGAQATLATALDQSKTAIINDAVWRCTGTLCSGPDGNGKMGNYRSCRELASSMGAVASYTTRKGPFTPEEIARCNAPGKTR